jgi:peroxiredoxin
VQEWQKVYAGLRNVALVVTVGVLVIGGYFGLRRSSTGLRLSRQPAVMSDSPAAPHIALTDLNGNSFNTSSYGGKVVLVNFWAAWCAPCAEEIPQFVNLQEKYRQQGLEVLGISMDDADDVLRKFYREHKMNYPVVQGDLKSADAYGGVPGLPTTYVIGRDGRVQSRRVGSTDFSSLEKEVVKLLGTPAQ